MKLVIEVNLDNAAFEQPGEIKNVLEQVPGRLDAGSAGESGSLKDSNGNTVGNWSIES